MSIREFKKELLRAILRQDNEETMRILSQIPDGAIRACQEVFHETVDCCTTSALELLIRAGADANLHDHEGRTPHGIFPIESCVSANNYANAQLLLENGADPNSGDPLMSLVDIEDSADQIRMCNLLLAHGAEINKELQAIPGYTPLCKALDHEAQELANHLKSRGALVPAIVDMSERALNLDTLQARLEEALLRFWDSMRNELPSEHCCLFGLETDGDCVLVNALFETEESIERDIKKKQSGRGNGQTHIERISLEDDAEYYGKGKPFLHELSMELNSVVLEQMPDHKDLARMKRVMKCLEGAIANLDQRGTFGIDKERERLLLIVSIIDADKRQWKEMLKIVKRLNPPTVSRLFIKSFG